MGDPDKAPLVWLLSVWQPSGEEKMSDKTLSGSGKQPLTSFGPAEHAVDVGGGGGSDYLAGWFLGETGGRGVHPIASVVGLIKDVIRPTKTSCVVRSFLEIVS